MAVEYFRFEEDFIEESVRCIPMIVRFKLDACGIKLKLMEWSKMKVTERSNLAEYSCQTTEEVAAYRRYVQQIVKVRAGQDVTDLLIVKNPLWATLTEVPGLFLEKLKELNLSVSVAQWQGLSALQRFALLKLCSPGHENKNFPLALEEFNLA
jgi:hypothetical protein